MTVKHLYKLTAAVLLFFVSTIAAFTEDLWALQVLDSSISPVISVFFFLLSLIAFLHVGGCYFTPAAMVLLAFAITLAFPSAYIGVLSGHDETQAAVTLALGFFLLGFWIWAATRPALRFQYIMSTVPDKTLSRTGLVFLASYPIVLLLFFYEERLTAIWSFGLLLYPVFFCSLAVIFFSRNHLTIFTYWVTLAASTWAVWYFFVFINSGRINVAVSILSVVIVASWLRPSIIYKAGILAAIIPGLIWAGMKRSGATDVEDILAHGDGLGSVMSPFNGTVDILNASGLQGLYPALDYFWQIIAGLFFWIPREWWASKPEGFGRLMVYEFLPWMSHTGHSMAGSIFGEGIAYFGFFGLIAGSLVLVVVVTVIEKLLFWIQARPPDLQLIGLSALSIGSGQILTLVWGGFFSFSVRSLSPAFLAIAIWVVFLMMKRVISNARKGKGAIYPR